MVISDPGKTYDATFDKREYYAEAALSLNNVLQIIHESGDTILDTSEIILIKRECEKQVALYDAVMTDCMRLENSANKAGIEFHD